LNQLPEDTEIFYADESGFEEHYSREYGYAERGKPVHGEVPGTRHGRTSVVGAIDNKNDFFAGFAFKGYMNNGLFVGWLEYVFAPALKNPEKSLLFIDNASHHPKDEIYDIAEEYGFTVIFLPRYSPDLNKIEKYWANIKNWLRLHLAKFDNFWDGFCYAFGCR
jgi:transposase